MLAALLIIFLQDLKSRAINWFLFPVLAAVFIIHAVVMKKMLTELYSSVLFNFLFVFIQLLGITFWFSFKEKRWVNVTIELLGWGDILLIACAAVYLSSLNFLLFNIISLILVLITWGFWQYFAKQKSKQIPLAGLQSLCLMFFLGADWFVYHFDATSDDWLLHYFIK